MTTNANYQCDHEENRLKVCAVCGSKIVFGSNPRRKFVLGIDLESLIQKYCNNNFNIFNSLFPKTICNSCKVALYDRNNENSSRSLPRMPDYLGIKLSNKTCSNRNRTCCYICQTGRLKTHKISEKAKTKASTLKICKICFAEIGKGKSHVCKRSVAHKNMLRNIRCVPEKTQDNTSYWLQKLGFLIHRPTYKMYR